MKKKRKRKSFMSFFFLFYLDNNKEARVNITMSEIKKSLDDYKQLNDGKVKNLEKSISEMRTLVAGFASAPKNQPKTMTITKMV